MSLMDEIQRCRQEVGGGPYFSKRDNQRYRKLHQEQIQKQEEEGHV